MRVAASLMLMRLYASEWGAWVLVCGGLGWPVHSAGVE